MIGLRPVEFDQFDYVAHLRVAVEQVKFSGSVGHAFVTKEAGVDFHAILWNAVPVGFFKIDRTYPDRHDFARDTELGLRGFLIDRNRQGQGIATAAVLALANYLTGLYPDAAALVLTVNCANPAAIKCYLKGGFRDTGQIHTQGSAGPQHVMRPATCHPPEAP